jgi:hypothetical protein
MLQESSARILPGLLSLAGQAALRIRTGVGSLDPAELIAEAERRAGRRLRARDVEPALGVLIEACEREADLSLFGRFSLRWDGLRRLRNLLRFEAAEDVDPGLVHAEVPAPIFVTGLPRSGTTFLHSLLAQGPDLRAPLAWQTIHPYPEARDAVRDGRARRVEREFCAFRRIAPSLGGLHPLSATMPQECTEITAHVFQSLRYDTTYYVPSYLGWLERRGHAAAFRFHRRFLQHLQAQGGGDRWVLKCPDHVFALDSIMATYPDARFVFVHRDPTSVLPSLAKLTSVLRAPFTRTLDKVAIGAEVAQRCAAGAERILQAARTLPENRIVHLHFHEVTTDPLGSLDKLHQHFGLTFAAAARDQAARFVESRPRGGYEANRYDPAEFGLEPGRVRRMYEGYIDAFGRAPLSAASSAARP